MENQETVLLNQALPTPTIQSLKLVEVTAPDGSSALVIVAQTSAGQLDLSVPTSAPKGVSVG